MLMMGMLKQNSSRQELLCERQRWVALLTGLDLPLLASVGMCW